MFGSMWAKTLQPTLQGPLLNYSKVLVAYQRCLTTFFQDDNNDEIKVAV